MSHLGSEMMGKILRIEDIIKFLVEDVKFFTKLGEQKPPALCTQGVGLIHI
jgi:hypothetical protein